MLCIFCMPGTGCMLQVIQRQVKIKSYTRNAGLIYDLLHNLVNGTGLSTLSEVH